MARAIRTSRSLALMLAIGGSSLVLSGCGIGSLDQALELGTRALPRGETAAVRGVPATTAGHAGASWALVRSPEQGRARSPVGE